MSRRLRYAEHEVAAAKLAAMVTARPAAKRRVITRARAAQDLERAIEARDYASLRPTHLVALWARCHGQVYGVEPAELDAAAWRGAAFAAARLVRGEFGGSMEAAVEFLRWTWRREQWREDKAREERNARVGRIGWRLQFVARHLLTDYRLDRARRRLPIGAKP